MSMSLRFCGKRQTNLNHKYVQILNIHKNMSDCHSECGLYHKTCKIVGIFVVKGAGDVKKPNK